LASGERILVPLAVPAVWGEPVKAAGSPSVWSSGSPEEDPKI